MYWNFFFILFLCAYLFNISILFCATFFFFLGLQVWHMEVPCLGIKLELQLPAFTTATAMQDLSCVCDLHPAHSNVGSLTH